MNAHAQRKTNNAPCLAVTAKCKPRTYPVVQNAISKTPAYTRSMRRLLILRSFGGPELCLSKVKDRFTSIRREAANATMVKLTASPFLSKAAAAHPSQYAKLNANTETNPRVSAYIPCDCSA